MFERAVEDKQQKIVGFCLIYGRGETFSGRTKEDWDRAPKEDVQLLLLYLDKLTHMGVPYRVATSGWDYYTYDGSNYRCSNDTRVLSGDIKYGWWTSDEEWKRLAHWALKEMKEPGGVLDADR